MGVEVETLVNGDGKTYPKEGDFLAMHYTGTLLNGTVFDSSIPKGRAFNFRIGKGQVSDSVLLFASSSKCICVYRLFVGGTKV